MDEIWKDVIGSEEYYQVSNLGRLRSKARSYIQNDGRRRNVESKILKLSLSKHGNYPIIRLKLNDESYKTTALHNIVSNTFLGPKPEFLEVRHLDGNPQNCAVINLKYGTGSENQLDKQIHGTDWQRNKTVCPLGHKLEEPNLREATANNGHRGCKACNQADASIAYYKSKGIILNKKEVADSKYAKIIKIA